MSNSKIPTAKELLDYYTKQCKGTAKTAMIEFAKLHVQAALEAAEKESVKYISKTVLELNMYNKTSIISAYPLENIK